MVRFIVLKPSSSFTYEVARKAAIVLRTSVSLCTVLSNPGVSIRLTRRPSRSKGANCTVFVQDRSPLQTLELDPLTRLTNFVVHCRVETHNKLSRFSLPSRKKTAVQEENVR